MKNIIEVVKANKTAIVKRGLIAVGAVAGLVVASKVLIGKGASDEEGEVVNDWTTDMDESTDSEEE